MRRGIAERDAVALQLARKKIESTCPEFFGPRRRAHLVVVAIEDGGRWSEEARGLLSALAIARARSELPLMRMRAEQAWRMRWRGMLACAVARVHKGGVFWERWWVFFWVGRGGFFFWARSTCTQDMSRRACALLRTREGP